MYKNIEWWKVDKFNDYDSVAYDLKELYGRTYGKTEEDRKPESYAEACDDKDSEYWE